MIRYTKTFKKAYQIKNKKMGKGGVSSYSRSYPFYVQIGRPGKDLESMAGVLEAGHSFCPDSAESD